MGKPAPDIDQARMAVEAIVDCAHRAGQIIQRLRGLSRGATDGKSLLLLNDVIQDVIPLIAPEMRINDVTLKLSLANDLPPVLGDRVQLQQVLLNLLMNGMHAMTESVCRYKVLGIETRRSANQVVVAVRDSGKGLDPAYLDRVFEPFFTTRANGVGIGLSVCQAIVKAHRGRIWAARNRGPGATFRFVLPIASRSAVDDELLQNSCDDGIRRC
jgi:C4-dicarboxylate-specific signal transduction histidine kinase